MQLLAALLLLAAPQEPAEDPDDGWAVAATVGATIVSGNNESTTAAANVSAERTWSGWAIGANAGYTGVRTTDKLTGDAQTTARVITFGANGKRYFDDTNNLYGYVKAGDRRDEPSGLIERWDAGAGAGYKFDLYTDAFLGTELGASWVNEELVGVVEEEETAVLRFAYNGVAPLVSTMEAYGNGEYMNGGEVESFTCLTGLRWPLNESLSLDLSLQVNWDGSPAPGFSSTDRIFVLGLTAKL